MLAYDNNKFLLTLMHTNILYLSFEYNYITMK